MGPIKVNTSGLTKLVDSTKKDISKVAGKIQIMSAKNAKRGPPILYAMEVRVCVDEGPGSI